MLQHDTQLRGAGILKFCHHNQKPFPGEICLAPFSRGQRILSACWRWCRCWMMKAGFIFKSGGAHQIYWRNGPAHLSTAGLVTSDGPHTFPSFDIFWTGLLLFFHIHRLVRDSHSVHLHPHISPWEKHCNQSPIDYWRYAIFTVNLTKKVCQNGLDEIISQKTSHHCTNLETKHELLPAQD